MKFIWADGHEIQLRMGSSVRGLRYKGEPAIKLELNSIDLLELHRALGNNLTSLDYLFDMSLVLRK